MPPSLMPEPGHIRIPPFHVRQYQARSTTMIPSRISREVVVQVIMAEKSRMMMAMAIRTSSFLSCFITYRLYSFGYEDIPFRMDRPLFNLTRMV
jgi:hypothetical protein